MLTVIIPRPGKEIKMNRTEIMEKLTQATAQMDDAALEDLANWAILSIKILRAKGFCR